MLHLPRSRVGVGEGGDVMSDTYMFYVPEALSDEAYGSADVGRSER